MHGEDSLAYLRKIGGAAGKCVCMRGEGGACGRGAKGGGKCRIVCYSQFLQQREVPLIKNERMKGNLSRN